MYEIIFLIILLGLSAFFSGAETALTSLTKIQLEDIKRNRKKGYQALIKLKSKPKKMLITILIGNNLVNIWLSALSTLLATNYFQSNVIGIVVGIVTFIILVFGEILPKNFCVVYNEQIALKVSKPLLFFEIIAFPIIKILQFISHTFFFVFNIKEPEDTVTEEEIKTTANLGKKHGTLDKQSTEIIHEVIDFNNTKVETIMNPESDMFCLNGETRLKTVMGSIIEHGYSRIPIYLKNKTNFIGVLHISQIMNFVCNDENIKLKDLNLNPIIYVHETKMIGSMLKDFQEKRAHFAIVIDEFGEIEGIITLEDVLEELVGEILDETDVEEKFIEKINEKKYIVDAQITLEELNEKLKLNLKSDEVNTLNGFILEKYGEVPIKGKKFAVGKKRFEIISRTKKKVKKVQLKL
jgi:CBS domain containing-hemolysin-like protein